MNPTELTKRRITLSIRTGYTRSPVDPKQQLTFRRTTELLEVDQRRADRLWRIIHDNDASDRCAERQPAIAEVANKREEHPTEREITLRRPALCDGPVVMGNSNTAWEENQRWWEYVCPNCGSRTVHGSVGLGASMGEVYEECKASLSSICFADMELIPRGFCSHCDPDEQMPSLCISVHFTDVPEREFLIRDDVGELRHLLPLLASDLTLGKKACLLGYWLRLARD